MRKLLKTAVLNQVSLEAFLTELVERIEALEARTANRTVETLHERVAELERR